MDSLLDHLLGLSVPEGMVVQIRSEDQVAVPMVLPGVQDVGVPQPIGVLGRNHIRLGTDDVKLEKQFVPFLRFVGLLDRPAFFLAGGVLGPRQVQQIDEEMRRLDGVGLEFSAWQERGGLSLVEHQ